MLWLILLLPAAFAAAQDAPHSRYDFMVYGVKHVSECAAPLQVLQVELQTVEFPDGWRFIVTCNPLSWEFARKVAGNPPTDRAFTDRHQHLTVVNATTLRMPRREYRHILVHELGHVTCDCNDEKTAEVFTAHFHCPRGIAASGVGGASGGH